MLGTTKDKPFVPFDAQYDILNLVQTPWPGVMPTGVPYPRIFCVCCGRRFGKTTIGEKLLWKGILAVEDEQGPPNVRLTADTEEHAMKIWRPFLYHMENTELQALVKKHDREFNRVEFYNGATVQMLSSHNPQALSGDGVTLWVIDEAQYITQAAWTNLFPSTSDRSGVIVMLGVAEGEGPFKELCYQADAGIPEIVHKSYPTSANPFVPRWDIEFARRHMPALKFKQLYDAQWVGELGKIFRGVEDNVTQDKVYQHSKGFGYVYLPKKGHLYYGGLDLARLQDWSVFSVWDSSGNLVAWDRFNAVSWELQKERVLQLSALYGHPLTYVDSTGIGDPLFEALLGKGLNAVEYKINSNDRKRALIDKLALRISGGNIRYPKIPRFINELNRMEAKQNEGSSVIRYEAPSGYTDDFVISAALAFQGVPEVITMPDPDLLYPDEDAEWVRGASDQVDVADLMYT